MKTENFPVIAEIIPREESDNEGEDEEEVWNSDES